MVVIIPDPPVESVDEETRIDRMNTREFINEDPINVQLREKIVTKTSGGGKKFEDGELRAQQVFRLIPQTDVMPEVRTPDGIQLTPTYVLLGEWDSTMGRWDTFSVNGVDYQITSPVRPHHTVENRYQTKADVARI